MLQSSRHPRTVDTRQSDFFAVIKASGLCAETVTPELITLVRGYNATWDAMEAERTPATVSSMESAHATLEALAVTAGLNTHTEVPALILAVTRYDARRSVGQMIEDIGRGIRDSQVLFNGKTIGESKTPPTRGPIGTLVEGVLAETLKQRCSRPADPQRHRHAA